MQRPNIEGMLSTAEKGHPWTTWWDYVQTLATYALSLEQANRALREAAQTIARMDPEHDGSCWFCGAGLALEGHFASCPWTAFKGGTDATA
jgi:hypothetical protein